MAYYLRAGGHMLVAESIEELADLVGCALEAGDEIALLRASGRRLLTTAEFGELLTRLSDSRRA